MMTKALHWSLALAVLLAPSLRAETKADAADVTRCEVSAYRNDPDPKGTNLRAAPNAKAAIVGVIPPAPPGENLEDTTETEFDVVGYKDGWFLVRNLSRGAFKGEGWVYGKLITGAPSSMKLLAAPANNAKMVASLFHDGTDKNGDYSYGPDSFEVLQIHACQGRFVEVTLRRVADEGKKPNPSMHGWLEGLCSNQLTTCS
jgi:hypothetical protein